MKSIIFNYRNDNNSALYHEIVEHDGRKFRIIMDIHNGSGRHNTNLSILLPDGTWGYVVDANVLDIELMSYVSAGKSTLVSECYHNRVRKTFINYIKKVYA